LALAEQAGQHRRVNAARGVVADLIGLWGIGSDADLAPAARSSNNQTFVVTWRNQRWVLRISQNLSLAQVRAEHRLLARLRGERLPFAVPKPVETLAGRTVAATEAGPATLCRWIGGHRPDVTDEHVLGQIGAAIGSLSQAMRLLPLDDAPQGRHQGPLAALTGGLSLDELLLALNAAGATSEHAALLRSAAQRGMAWWQGAARELPVQVVHDDLGPSNVLVDPASGQVTGVLDFEIAGTDFRVQDLVVALLLFGMLDGAGWPDRAAALAGGMASVQRLDPAEIRAVPELLICRSVASVLWRAGRWHRGLALASDVIDRLNQLDATMTFTARQAGQLVDLLARANDALPGDSLERG